MDEGPKQRALERARIEEEAASFVVRLAESDSAELRRTVEAWIAQSFFHGVALARAEAAWESAGRLRAAPPPVIPEAVAGPAGEIEAIFTRRRAMSALVAISTLAGLSTVAIEKITAVDRYRTDVGEQRTVVLADGSRIRLNTATTVEIALYRRERSVRILDGEAMFDVAPDPARPFVVMAHGSIIRALGTRFNLRIRPALVELTVTHGAVAVRDGASGMTRVVAGDGAAIRKGLIAQSSLDPDILRQRIDWLNGMIDLSGVSLGQAVEEFNRYRLHPLVIGDSRLFTLPVAGRYRTTDSARFLETLEQQQAVRAEPAADHSLLLVQSPDKEG